MMLDVGSGHNPHEAADVLADAYLHNEERADDAVLDRPFVQADIENLPFKDNAFEFVNASQVVEHTDNPYQAVAELERVGKSGQVDTPSIISENVLFGQEFHTVAMLSYNDHVLFVPSKRNTSKLHRLSDQSQVLNLLLLGLDRLFPVRIARYYWGDGKSIHFRLKRQTADSKIIKTVYFFDQYIGSQLKSAANRVIAAVKSDEFISPSNSDDTG